MKLLAVSLFLISAPSFCRGFAPLAQNSGVVTRVVVAHNVLSSSSSSDDNEEESASAWDDDVDYDKVWENNDKKEENIMPTSEWNDSRRVEDDKLQIPKEVLEDLVLDEEAKREVKEAARKIIEEKTQQGLDSLEQMRKKLKDDIESQQRYKQRNAEERAENASKGLMNRINAKSDAFLESTRSTRESTKRAATADALMEGKGIDIGSWGSLDNGAIVPTGGLVLGSTDNMRKKQQRQQDGEATDDDDDEEINEESTQNRILIIADKSSDQTAKSILPRFCERLEDIMTGIDIEVLKPTQVIPIGGNDAACVIFFLTSISSNPQMERLLQRTMKADGTIGKPPTQFIGVSTVGTTRTNKMPYSMQNILGGGKLTNRLDTEDFIRNFVMNRKTQQNNIDPALDYTIVKFGDIKDNGVDNDFSFMPGDVLDGPISVDTAAQVLLQAMALQPLARNSTLCATGNLPAENPDLVWDDAFLKLRGPELKRYDDDKINSLSNDLFDQLTEYLKEWAMLLIKSEKLTTPVVYEPSLLEPNTVFEGVSQRDGFKLVFQTTRTGANYVTSVEQRKLEKKGKDFTPNKPLKQKPEGGIEILVEITTQDRLRVRATRTNMASKTVIKELSETSILRRLEDSLNEFVKLYA
eukprot:CAMPEP_0194136736 /NCGR_PEP_ID=MMETSP0152-20130528/6735_1 /TAXON_ID=1049557 /ORGANISM="Thalassiothrix antarctica, Strain L6-D1" /LENGTH=638 /DNA_ID=CAMNT_0038833515 /DNA_START=126 /DNA_END=2042 /DNA_ORIENTATION=-